MRIETSWSVSFHKPVLSVPTPAGVWELLVRNGSVAPPAARFRFPVVPVAPTVTADPAVDSIVRGFWQVQGLCYASSRASAADQRAARDPCTSLQHCSSVSWSQLSSGSVVPPLASTLPRSADV